MTKPTHEKLQIPFFIDEATHPRCLIRINPFDPVAPHYTGCSNRFIPLQIIRK